MPVLHKIFILKVVIISDFVYLCHMSDILYWTLASSENSVVKGVKKFLQASGKAERSQMFIMLYQAKLMA